jgi:hypothetical protein
MRGITPDIGFHSIFCHLKPVREHSNKKEIDTIIIEAY